MEYIQVTRDNIKEEHICCAISNNNEKGYVLYYTSQCPFNAKYVPILERTAQENDISGAMSRFKAN